MLDLDLLEIEPKETQRVVMAKKFSQYFSTEFADCIRDKLELFAITKDDFDEFIIVNSFCSYSSIPQKDTAEWKDFRGQVNSKRYEINKASAFALHGEPAFRLDAEKEQIAVRLLTNIIKVTPHQIGKSIESLVTTKVQDFTAMDEYIEDNLHNLPLVLQGEANGQKKIFDMTMSTVSHSLTIYINSTKDTYAKAAAHMKKLENNSTTN